MVISIGMIVPFISLVRSLNCITNWPMFTPCWPNAGPTGGAGVAWPPGHWSFTFAVITLAIVRLSRSSFLGWAPPTDLLEGKGRVGLCPTHASRSDRSNRPVFGDQVRDSAKIALVSRQE